MLRAVRPLASIALIVLCTRTFADTSTGERISLIHPGRDCAELQKQVPVGKSALQMSVPSTHGKPDKLLSALIGDAASPGSLPVSLALTDHGRVIATSRPQCLPVTNDVGTTMRCWMDLGAPIKREREGELTLILDNTTARAAAQHLRICVFDPYE